MFDYIPPHILIPAAIVLWSALWLLLTAPKRRTRRRARQLARLGL